MTIQRAVDLLAATLALIAGVVGVIGAFSMWREWQEHGTSPWWLLTGGILACMVGALLFRMSPRGKGH